MSFGIISASNLSIPSGTNLPVSYADTANLDAFSRLRISQPIELFSTQTQYDSDPLLMEVGATGTGVSPTHSSNTRMVELSTTAGSGTSFIQSYQYVPYQPSKSHLIFVTGVLGSAVENSVVDVGYFDSANGIFYRQNGINGLEIVLRSSTSGGVNNNAIPQVGWNLDPLNGSGASGITLDPTKDFILVIDLQFLAMGRVRIGFDIGGVIIYAHEFLNSNIISVPYMQTATLPVQMLITSTSSGSTKTSYFKCAAVNTEGGADTANIELGYSFSTPRVASNAGNMVRNHAFSIRPKTTFKGLTNREKFVFNQIDIINTGNSNVYWELCIGATFSAAPTYADVNANYSAFEVGTGGTFGNLTNGLVFASGFAVSQGNSRVQVAEVISNRYPITLDRAGAVRDMGTLTLLLTGITNSSACQSGCIFKEIR
jgi:hypothetical protein